MQQFGEYTQVVFPEGVEAERVKSETNRAAGDTIKRSSNIIEVTVAGAI